MEPRCDSFSTSNGANVSALPYSHSISISRQDVERIIKRTVCIVGLAYLIYWFGFMNEFGVNLEIEARHRGF